MTVFKTEGQKYQKTLQIFKKCTTINTQCDAKKTTQPIREESYPHLPSKPIRDGTEKITTIRATMSLVREVQ